MAAKVKVKTTPVFIGRIDDRFADLIESLVDVLLQRLDRTGTRVDDDAFLRIVGVDTTTIWIEKPLAEIFGVVDGAFQSAITRIIVDADDERVVFHGYFTYCSRLSSVLISSAKPP